MAHEIAYVDNTGTEGSAHWQLLLAIKALAEANGWVTMRYDDTLAKRELILKGQGLSADQEIYIGLRTYEDAGADYYNISVAGFTGYVAGNTFEAQPGYIESGIPAHNLRIDYWLAVNAQRIVFGLKVGTPVYEHGYAGYFLPYASPDQYPYPLVIGGMLDGLAATRFSDSAHSMPYKGTRVNLRMRFIDGTWKQPDAWPWINASLAASVNSLRDTNGDYPLMPVVLSDAGNVYGELDGVRHISGFGNAVENTLTISTVEHVVLQDVARTGFPDYVALEMN